jgi:hypothetical protein
MKRVLLFVALTVVVSGGCRKRGSDDPGQYSGGGNPTGYGAEQAVRGAVKRTVTAAELHDLHLMLNTAKGASGRVPTSQETWNLLNQPDGNRQLAKLIQDQVITLVPNPQDEGLWAYGTEVPTEGGWILTHNGAERVTAQDFNARYGRQ